LQKQVNTPPAAQAVECPATLDDSRASGCCAPMLLVVWK
jgi:hypothetical protein